MAARTPAAREPETIRMSPPAKQATRRTSVRLLTLCTPSGAWTNHLPSASSPSDQTFPLRCAGGSRGSSSCAFPHLPASCEKPSSYLCSLFQQPLEFILDRLVSVIPKVKDPCFYEWRPPALPRTESLHPPPAEIQIRATVLSGNVISTFFSLLPLDIVSVLVLTFPPSTSMTTFLLSRRMRFASATLRP